MPADELDQLHHEVSQLHTEINALTDAVDELARSIRYLTNNLLDEQHNLALAAQVKHVANGSPAKQDQQEANASEMERVAPAVIPDRVRDEVGRIVRDLQERGAQLTRAEDFGSVTAMQWWENSGQTILKHNRRLVELQELAESHDCDLQPLIAELGEIPETMLIEDVPDLASEPAFPDREASSGSESQPTLFAATQPAVDAATTTSKYQRTATFPLFPLRTPSKGLWSPLRNNIRHIPSKITSSSGSGSGLVSRSPLLTTFAAKSQAMIAGRRPSSSTWWPIITLIASNLLPLATAIYDRIRSPSSNAVSVFHARLQMLSLQDGIAYSPMSETFEEAIVRYMVDLTDEDLTKDLADYQQRLADREKAISDPETLPEFRQFVRSRGEDKLDSQQRITLDQLQADELDKPEPRSSNARAWRRSKLTGWSASG